MPEWMLANYGRLLSKKHDLLKDIEKALLFQKKALEGRDTDRIVLYSDYISSRKDEIESLDRILSASGNDFDEDYVSLKEDLNSLKEGLLRLCSSNIGMFRESMEEIERQIRSVKLLNKRNNLYNPVSKSERIDITR
ncbi:MAG: hypothetical protein DRP59_04140 [Spirochaetes bacterium]|nr:MAG: hypothetical protein DRP59_04140 [Spirochaetota bacterium]